jgi:hypothetical protein
MDVSMWKQLMCRLYKGIDERVIPFLARGLVKAKVQFVVQQFFALPIESTTMSELLKGSLTLVPQSSTTGSVRDGVFQHKAWLKPTWRRR